MSEYLGYMVLSVVDRIDEKFTLKWLGEMVTLHQPGIIVVNPYQAKFMGATGDFKGLRFRGIPCQVTESSFFGRTPTVIRTDLLSKIKWKLRHPIHWYKTHKVHKS